MNVPVANAPARQVTKMDEFRARLNLMRPQFELVLPQHVPAERFARIVQTAVMRDPKLLDVNRTSLFEACMRAAQDGLVPDGREGAIVRFKSEAQWLPMVQGLLKRTRQSGDIKSIAVNLVYEGENFRAWTDERGDHIRHEPDPFKDRSQQKGVRGVYAVAVTKSGGSYIEIMSLAEIEKARKKSRASRDDAPWKQWWSEMARKTVLRRLSKRLPSSVDLDGAWNDEPAAAVPIDAADALPEPKADETPLLDALDAFGEGGEEDLAQEARTRAERGTEALQAWWDSLEDEDQQPLRSAIGELREIAERADGERDG